MDLLCFLIFRGAIESDVPCISSSGGRDDDTQSMPDVHSRESAETAAQTALLID